MFTNKQGQWDKVHNRYTTDRNTQQGFHPEVRGERREPLADKAWESTLLLRSGGVKGLTGSGAVNFGVSLE